MGYDQDFEIDPVTPPLGLFPRIIKRLGLEKELSLVKKHLGFFVTLFAVFLILSIFSFIGLRQVLKESSFGSFLSLIFSDPKIVLIYWHSFIFSIFESMSWISVFLLLFAVALLLLFVRLAVISADKLSILIKNIKSNQKHKYE